MATPRLSIVAILVVVTWGLGCNSRTENTERKSTLPPDIGHVEETDELPRPKLSEPQPITDQTAEHSKPKQSKAYQLSFNQLKEEYSKDWQNTIRKYRNHELEISGPVIAPTRRTFGNEGEIFELVMSETGGPFELAIHAEWPVKEGDQKTRTIAPKQTVVVRGKYIHEPPTHHEWSLYNAKIISIGENPSLVMTVRELWDQIESHPKLEDSPILGKPIRLKGMITRITSVGRNHFQVWLKEPDSNADEKQIVKVSLPVTHFDRMGQLPFTADELVQLNLFKVGETAEFHIEPISDRFTYENTANGIDFIHAAYPAYWPEGWDKLLTKDPPSDTE